MEDETANPHVRPATPEEAADVRGMHAANARGLGRGRRAVRGLVRRGGRAHPRRRLEPLPVELDLIGDLRGSLPPRDPPPVRRRPRHAVALDGRRGRGRGRRLQPADARARRPPDGRDGRSRAMGRGGRPRYAARPRRHRRPAVHGPGRDPVAPGPRRLGGRAAAAPRAGGAARDLRRPPGRVAVRRRRGRPVAPHRLRLLRRRRGVARVGARVHRPAVDPRRRPAPQVRPVLDAGRDRHRPARRRACASSA